MERVKLPPWSVILLHLGACDEAIVWAERRPVSWRTFQACQSNWQAWLAKRLHVSISRPWADFVVALRKALNGSGSGYGYGDGYGSGYGYGYGDGSGSGYGSGYGYGYGDGSGYGSGDVV